MKMAKLISRMFFVALLVGFATGCQMLLNDLQGKPLFDKAIPTYPHEEEVAYGDGVFKFKIEKVNWGADSISIDVSATSTAKKPVRMSCGYTFFLMNEENETEYSPTYSGDAAAFVSGGTNIAPIYNPNSKKTATLTFPDVPKGNYSLIVAQVIYHGNINNSETIKIYKWKLKQP